MEIIEYTPDFEDTVKDLLVELQSHLAAIDPTTSSLCATPIATVTSHTQ